MTEKNMHPLTKWAIEKIEKEYPDDIALLLGVPGHETDGDAHGTCFDYFVPATERGNELAQTFIIDGVGHDLYPRSWERVERSVTLDDMAGVLARAEILYARTDEDRERFEALRAKLFENLADPVFVYEKALSFLDEATEIYRSFAFETLGFRARSEAEMIQRCLTQAVAVMNHSYADDAVFSERQAYESQENDRIYTCPELVRVPDGFFVNARKLLSPQPLPKLRATVHALIDATRKFVLSEGCAEEKKAAPDYEAFAGWYREMSLTFRRLRYYCREGLAEKAYWDASYLQEEFLYIAAEWGLDAYNLLDSFDPQDLRLTALRADRIEHEIRGILKEHDQLTGEYATLEEFLEAEGMKQ